MSEEWDRDQSDPADVEDSYCFRQCGERAFCCRITLARCLAEARGERRLQELRDGER